MARRKAKAPTPLEDQCGAHKKGGGTCTRPKGWGTDHQGFGNCKFHGGATKTGRKHAATQEAHAMATSGVVMGMPLDVDPHEALLHCVRITAGEVAYATSMVHKLSEEEALTQARSEEYKPQVGLDTEGSIKRDLGIDKVTLASQSLNIWIQVRQQAVDKLAKYSKMAIDVGVAERQVRLAETKGEEIATALKAIMSELGLNQKQSALLPEAIRKHLTAIEGESLQLSSEQFSTS